MKKLILTLACTLSLMFASAGNYKVERDIAYRTSEDNYTRQLWFATVALWAQDKEFLKKVR